MSKDGVLEEARMFLDDLEKKEASRTIETTREVIKVVAQEEPQDNVFFLTVKKFDVSGAVPEIDMHIHRYVRLNFLPEDIIHQIEAFSRGITVEQWKEMKSEKKKGLLAEATGEIFTWDSE